MHQGQCIFCGVTWVQGHHIVHKGRGHPKKYDYLDYKLNRADLCTKCHTGEIGVHSSSEIGIKRDLQLKQELQAKLNKVFSKDNYTAEEIKKILSINSNQLGALLKLLPVGQAYKREDIIRQLMGGRLY